MNNLSLMWNNPVIVRDMRIRMRGTRAFWNQAIYLAVLSIIAVTGYATSTSLAGLSLSDPIEIQQKLQQFYYWIFEGLAVLITLIAPALTAVSIISEKKMQTLDLLVTTPMSSMQMLLGKLISSIAFIILLLVLSIPASALCIILGGATIGDVLQSYFLLATSGVLMSAIGLAASCSAKQHIQAIITTYSAIILLLIVTAIFGSAYTAETVARAGSAAHASAPALAAFFELNPFLSSAFPSFNIAVLGVNIPVWLATAVVCFLLVRLILTGAALNLGTYGTALAASQRRQVLFATELFSFLLGQSLDSVIGSTTTSAVDMSVIIISASVFAISLFFLPTMFVPALQDDAAPGEVVVGSYDFRQAFGTFHSGSLPFFQIWLFSLIMGVLIGIAIPSGAMPSPFYLPAVTAATVRTPLSELLPVAGYTYLYLSGLGFLLWSIARRSATWSNAAAPARSITFLIFVFVMLLPCMIMLVQSGMATGDSFDPFQQSDVRYFWFLYPFTDWDNSSRNLPWIPFLVYGFASYVLGLLIYPVTRDVIPGSKAMANRNTAKPIKVK